jgi:selenoprotein W-related protein
MQFKQRIKGLKLIPSKGGCFELTANGEVLYSKLATGRFPEEQKLLDLLESKLK